MTIPHWAPPTHAMQIFSYAETGSIGLLWISATNPAVSMPESARIRRILGGDQCFVVVQDLFLTETAELADVVLPAAGWGEKTGCFTNVNRTVHLSEKAVDPPGEARSDLDIFLMYADAMGFTNRSGRAADRVAHTRGGLRRVGGHHRRPPGRLHRPVLRQAPRTHAASRGRSTRSTPTAPTGSTPTPSSRPTPTTARPTATTSSPAAPSPRHEHRAMSPAGRAFLKGAPYTPPHEEPSARLPAALHHRPHRLPLPHPHQDRPLRRPQPGRTRRVGRDLSRPTQTRAASPKATGCAWSRPAAPSRSVPGSGDVMEGAVFAPFHYGHWEPDAAHGGGHDDASHRLANELTMTVWDPVSKQPTFKTAACQVTRLRDGDGPHPRPPRRHPHPASARPPAGRRADGPPQGGGPTPAPCSTDTPHYSLDPSPGGAADATPDDLHRAGRPQRTDPRRLVPHGRRGPRAGRPTCSTPASMLAGWSDDHRDGPRTDHRALRRGATSTSPNGSTPPASAETRDGEIGLLRDLQDLHVLATLVQTTWTVIAQGAQGLRDQRAARGRHRARMRRPSRQLTWLNTRMKAAAPQALIVAP